MAGGTRSPTLDILGVMAGVYVLQVLGTTVGLDPAWFVLAAPLEVNGWTLVTSVYAHASLSHLVANAVGLALVGFPLERTSSWLRFQVFFLVTGMLAGTTEVLVGGLVGQAPSVLGASGAVFALFGYAAVGNRLVGPVFDRFAPSRRAQLLLFAGVALVVTLVTAAPGVALVAHFTGLVVGAGAGRLGVLRAA